MAFDGCLGKYLALGSEFDLIVMDVNLPGINNYDLCQQLRQEGVTAPILMLTALDTVDDKVQGYDSGADDYLVKPFEFRKLIARVKVLSKRKYSAEGNQKSLKIADPALNLDEKTARRSGLRIDLTAKKFAEKVRDICFDTGANVMDVYTDFLRKKSIRPTPPSSSTPWWAADTTGLSKLRRLRDILALG